MLGDAEELYRLYHRMIFLYLLRLSGSVETAEELLQETFYQAIRGAATYRGEASPATWLCTIARNLFLNQVARQSRERERRQVADLDGLMDLQPGPESSLDRHDQQRRIAAVLALLPAQQRVALLLRDADGLAYQEIADLLGLSVANVKVTIHRARIRFRTLYSEQKEA